MVIGKNCLAANGKSPISEIAEECVWITETAECKKRTGADFIGGERTDRTAEAAEPQQSRRRSENWVLIELPDGLERSRCRFGAREDNQICAAHGRYWFPKPAGRQQGFPSQRPRRVQ